MFITLKQVSVKEFACRHVYGRLKKEQNTKKERGVNLKKYKKHGVLICRTPYYFIYVLYHIRHNMSRGIWHFFGIFSALSVGCVGIYCI